MSARKGNWSEVYIGIPKNPLNYKTNFDSDVLAFGLTQLQSPVVMHHALTR